MIQEKAVEYDPKNVKYLENLAALYQAVQNREKAAEMCRKILELDPKQQRALDYLASLGATSVGATDSANSTSAPTSQP